MFQRTRLPATLAHELLRPRAVTVARAAVVRLRGQLPPLVAQRSTFRLSPCWLPFPSRVDRHNPRPLLAPASTPRLVPRPQGVPGEGFYIVESGQLDVLVRKPDSSLVLVHTFLAQGDVLSTFGELSLLYGKPQAAHVVARTDGVLLLLQRSVFKAITARHDAAADVRALRAVTALANLSGGQLAALLGAMAPVAYGPGAVIAKQGDLLEGFGLVTAGEVRGGCARLHAPRATTTRRDSGLGDLLGSSTVAVRGRVERGAGEGVSRPRQALAPRPAPPLSSPPRFNPLPTACALKNLLEEHPCSQCEPPPPPPLSPLRQMHCKIRDPDTGAVDGKLGQRRFRRRHIELNSPWQRRVPASPE